MADPQSIVLQPDLIKGIARKIYDLVEDPNLPKSDLAAMCRLQLHDLSGKRPVSLWNVLGNALPITVQEQTDWMDRLNWTAVVKISALFVSSNVPRANAVSIETAFRSAGVSIQRYHMVFNSDTKEGLRLTLADCARTMASMGISFSIEEAAELLMA